MWIHTYLGNEFHYGKPNKVYIEDIAHHLSNICRFTGATKDFYSVAQHSWWVATLLDKESVVCQLHGLLHDAHEAYTGDINTPLQQYWDRTSYTFAAIERTQDAADHDIYKSLGLPFPTPFEAAKVKQADRVMFATEASQLLRGGKPAWLDSRWPEPLSLTIYPRSPNDAKQLFLMKYRELICKLESVAA